MSAVCIEKERQTADNVLISNDKSGFVSLADVIPDAVFDIRYYSSFNFVGERIDFYEAPVAYLAKVAATALKKASEDLKKQGYLIKIYDAYRPQTAVDHFKRWAEDLSDTRMKPYFYPDIDKSDILPKGYIAKRSGHSRGAAVDLSLVYASTGEDVDMGSDFDLFGEISHSGYTRTLTDEQIENRRILRLSMVKNGFSPLAEEWWHFSLENEPYPDTYFDFPVTLP